MKPSRLSTTSGGDSPGGWRHADAQPPSLSFLRSSPSPSMMIRLEQEVAWNPAQVYVDLQAACQILSQRGWKLAAKWAAEVWMGLPAVDDLLSAPGATRLTPNHIPDNLKEELQQPVLAASPMLSYAKTLVDLGEFAHAAAILSLPHSTVERMPSPQPDLNAAGIALRAYALYMAGERRKEEALQENSGYVIGKLFSMYNCFYCFRNVISFHSLLHHFCFFVF